MRQVAAIAALWGCVASAQAASGVSCLDDDCLTLRSTGTRAPLFSFASPTRFAGYAAYAGLPATDGCYAAASITGTKGEALTFTRATTRFCPTDGTANEATGVMCASGEVCIRALNGKRGISIFRAGTNVALRSEEFDNAAWTKLNATVTADYVVAPDGTTTADRVQIASCVGAQNIVYQSGLNPTSPAIGSVWLKANAGTPTVQLCVFDAGSVTGTCSQHALTSAWKRVSHSNTYTGTTSIVIGCIDSALYTGDGNTGAADFSVWGGDLKTGTYATPYIKTTSAAATRNAETAEFAVSTVPVASAGSASVGFVSTYAGSTIGGVNSMGILGLNSDGRLGYTEFGTGRLRMYDGTTEGTVLTNSFAVGLNHLFFTWGVGGNMTITNSTSGESATNAFDGTMGTSTAFRVCYSFSNGQADGLCSGVCLDTDPARCR